MDKILEYRLSSEMGPKISDLKLGSIMELKIWDWGLKF